MPWDAHEKVVQALESKISTYQVGASAVIAALIAALGVLWLALNAKEKKIEEKDKILLDEVRAAQGGREKILESNEATRDVLREVAAALKEVRGDVQFCKERRDREEASVGRG